MGTSRAGDLQPTHEYHAEAHALSGHVDLPVSQKIYKLAAVELSDWRGGHNSQRNDHYNLEGIISFKSGYTHVSGNPSMKEGHGWVTLATSVLEGLNVLDVITADRITAQVSTEHPLKNGYVPHVTFLGTRFENLRVSGYEVKLELDLEFCGSKPDGDISYLQNANFLDRVERQHAQIVSAPELPRNTKAEYDKELSNLREIKAQCKGSGQGTGNERKVKCSLVKSIEPIPVAKTYGNILEIPGFGIVSLADLHVGTKPIEDPQSSHPYSHYFTLAMINMRMGCIGEGMVSGAGVTANGHTRP